MAEHDHHHDAAAGERVGSVWLPTKPDPDTGNPRPPHAPAFSGKDTAPELDTNRDSTVSRKHEPPPGQGPVLAWYRASRRGSFYGALWVVGLVCVGLWVSRGFDFTVFGFWQVWLVIIAGGVLGFFIGKSENCAAGAEWVMENKTWVRTYELVTIKAYPYSNTLNLHLTDSGDRKLEISLSRLQDDRRIWDYVYNGLLHSVVKNRADTNALARRTLGLPKTDYSTG